MDAECGSATDAKPDGALILALQGDDRVAVRAVLATAVRRWRARGLTVLGTVEVLPDAGAPDDVLLCDLATGLTHPLTQHLGPGASGCTLDLAGLTAACAGVEAAIADFLAQPKPKDAVVVLSKFGRQEAHGRGLADAFAAAVAAGLPILTSVSPLFRDAWIDFAGDFARFAPVHDQIVEAWLERDPIRLT